jgi:hypothetical protein
MNDVLCWWILSNEYVWNLKVKTQRLYMWTIYSYVYISSYKQHISALIQSGANVFIQHDRLTSFQLFADLSTNQMVRE